MDISWEKGIIKNFAQIVQQLRNVDEVAEKLHSDPDPPLIKEEELEQISKLKTTQRKTRKMLDLIHAQGERSLKELYIALEKTKNTHLAELLAPYVKMQEKSQKDITKRMNPTWPPTEDELERMHNDPVTPCDLTSPTFIIPYRNKEKNYQMTRKKRGVAVIINNMFSMNKDLRRHGSDNDCKRMKKVLEQLHFKVKVYNELTAQEMKNAASETAVDQDLQKADCFIFVIMSHGSKDGICGVDKEVILESDLASPFYSNNCPALEGKPKIFIIQACRGTSEETTTGESSKSDTTQKDGPQSGPQDTDKAESDAKAKKPPVPQIQHTANVFSHADFLFAHATPEGYKAYRSTLRGSWFLQAIVWLLKYQSHEDHLLDILTQVNSLVSIGRAEDEESGLARLTVSECNNKLTKNLYFFPGVYDYPPRSMSN